MRKLSGRSAVLLGALFVVSGCGMVPGGPFGSSPDEPDRPIVGDPPPSDPLPDGSLRVEPVDGIVGARPHAVERFVIGPDGRTVVVHWVGGVEDCFGLERIDVDESGDVPLITVFEGSRAEAVGQACIMLGVLKSAVVRLSQPIVRDAHLQDDGEPGGEPLTGGVPVDPEDGLVSVRPTVASGYELPGDGRTLSISYVGGTEDCYGLAEVRLQPGGPPVIALFEGSRPLGDQACPDIGILKTVSVELSEPILSDGSLARG